MKFHSAVNNPESVNVDTAFCCHHPKASRSLLPCGKVETCGECFESRFVSTSRWRPAKRRQVRTDDGLVMFGVGAERERLYGRVA